MKVSGPPVCLFINTVKDILAKPHVTQVFIQPISHKNPVHESNYFGCRKHRYQEWLAPDSRSLSSSVVAYILKVKCQKELGKGAEQL